MSRQSMSQRRRNQRDLHQADQRRMRCILSVFEPLEGRCLLSASPLDHSGPPPQDGGGGGGVGPGGPGAIGQSIEFSQAPTVVQTGLIALASADSDPAPTATTPVRLGNRNGIETYSIKETSTSTTTTTTPSSSSDDSATATTPPAQIAVDVDGNPVTAPTQTTTTFGAITNTAVTDELTAIAAALNLTAPASTDTVNVSTASDGAITYSIDFSSATSTTSSSTSTSTDDTGPAGRPGGAHVSVDASGNPVGTAQLPLSVFSTAVQSGLTSNAPSGATALTSTSLIQVATIDGVTLYTAHYSSTGTQTTITVDTAGTLTSLPASTQVDFSTLPSAAQDELQTLATADGYTGTISTTQTVTEYTEPNGTVIYAVSLSVAGSTDSSDSGGDAAMTMISIAVDAAGNPTVPPMGGFGGPVGGGGQGGGGGGGQGGGGCASGSTGSGSDTGNSSDAGNTATSPGNDPSNGSDTSTGSSADPGNSDCPPTTTGGSATSTTPVATSTVATSTTTATTPTTKAAKIAALKAAIAAKKAAIVAALQQKKAAALAAKKAAVAVKAAALAAKKAELAAAKA